MRPDPNSTTPDLMDLSITIRDDDMPRSLIDTISALNDIKNQDLLTGLLSLQHVSNQIGKATRGLENTKLVKINNRIQKAYEVKAKPKTQIQHHGVEETKEKLGGMRILQSMAQRSATSIGSTAAEPVLSPLTTPDPKDSPSSGQTA